MSDNIVDFRRPGPTPKGNPVDDAFVLGWEFGRIEAILAAAPELEMNVHWENQARLEDLADKRGYTANFSALEPPTEGWLWATFKRRHPEGGEA